MSVGHRYRLPLKFGAGFGDKIARRLAEFREPLVRQDAAFDDRLDRGPEHLADRGCQQIRIEPDS
jgi:hypothetical protein